MHSSILRRLLPLLLAFLPAFCGQRHREHGLIFSDWYVVKPIAKTGMTTAYGSVSNTLAEPVSLTAVTLSCAEKTEMHETIENGGRVSMVALSNIVLPAGETVAFRPGQKHLMVSGLQPPQDELCEAVFTIAGRPSRFTIPLRERKD